MIETILISIWFIALILWFINSMSLLKLSFKISDELINAGIYGYVEEVYRYHDSTSFKNWLGLRPRFKPYVKPTAAKPW